MEMLRNEANRGVTILFSATSLTSSSIENIDKVIL